MNIEIPSRYSASESQSKWYQTWESAGLFKPDIDLTKPTYTITIPPPNITGSLHMGHALCYPLQDFFGRFHRLLGKRVLILPGQDHAGIATQSVVEKNLKKQGLSGAQLGREAFVEKVWEWREESGNTILSQFRALGCSFDWSRLRFTLDDQYANAVLKVFVDWYNRGYIYRGLRVVNWDPKLKTSVSDIETLRETRRGHLYHLRYRFTDGSGEIVIATTRPETMLADVAVAVHPSDKRYEGKIGKKLLLPLVGREIPLIADLYPDPEFGTGAVKITPAHDPNDYEVGVRHGLDMPIILDKDARIKLDWIKENEPNLYENVEKYEGLDRNEARKAIVADLEESGDLVEREDHDIPLIISDRSGEVIEPLLSEQWFARQTSLADPVIKAVQNGEVNFHPARYRDTFLAWMENIKDWNISRQLWWGHRVPAFYTSDDECFVALTWEDAQALAGNKKIVRQDDDVLDTWFSSGLWPFVTLGWPDQTEDLKQFYPTNLLVTDRNIINLWVARMLMMGYDLTGTKPFSDVMIYATVLREDGRRMSKSLGTGIDPMEIIEEMGTDALRWALLSQTGENQDLRYGPKKVEDGRNFCNKIWNATRFVLMNVEKQPATPSELEEVDEWLLSRLVSAEREVRDAYENYDLQLACQTLYRFFWGDVCDWYIEISKSRLQSESERETPQWVLLRCFDAFLKMLHPVMPFITEELYQYLPFENKKEFIAQESWPTLKDLNLRAESGASVQKILNSIRSLRALRAELDLKPMQTIERAYFEGEIGANESIIRSQAWTKELIHGKPEGRYVSVTSEGIDFHLEIEGLVDFDKIIQSVSRDLDKSVIEHDKLAARLENPQFVEKAKPEIIERDREQLAQLKDKIEKLRARRLLFGS
jgi:valyl-tRNA synthetase